MPKINAFEAKNWRTFPHAIDLVAPTHLGAYPIAKEAPLIVAAGNTVLGTAYFRARSTKQRYIDLALTPADIQVFQAIDATDQPRPSLLCQAAAILKNHRVELPLISTILNISDPTTASRLISLAKCPDLLPAFDNGCSLGHLRLLMPLDPANRQKQLSDWFAKKCSVKALGQRIQQKAAPQSLDTNHLNNQLSQYFHAATNLSWPEAGLKSLDIAYYTIEELQGLLQRIGEASCHDPETSLPAQKRILTIQFLNADEYQALLGNVPEI